MAADRILTSWHESGVKTMTDINVLDQKHSSRQAAQQFSTKSDSGRRKTSSGNRFNNFTQRDYDFHSLEQLLLKNQQAKSETE